MKKKIVICVVIVVLLTIVSSALSQNTLSDYLNHRATPAPTKSPNSNIVTWKCVDATSYDGNAYNDNKCTSSKGEVRYVSDSQAIRLDPYYRPGKTGAYYYNNK